MLLRFFAITECRSVDTAVVVQALAGNPGLVYVSTYYPEGSKIATALQAAGHTPTCLMELANTTCTFAAAFMRDYRRAFDKEPGVWGIFTYDSAKVLFAAMNKAGKTSFDSVLGDLKKTSNFKGATGTITIDPSTGNREVVPVYILKVDDRGEFVISGS